uniref:Uncharacterized protein n=1 Tax=viral metagenome TaxID=1070528 RepID=A0A6M3L727_9ZZZZ
MTRAGKWTNVFVDGYAITSYSHSVEMTIEYDTEDGSAFEQDKNYTSLQGDGSATIDGYLSADVISALQTISGGKVITIPLGNNATPAIGDPAFMMNGCQGNYKVNSPKGGLQAANAAFKQANDAVWGVLLAKETGISADGNSTSVDQTAQTTAGGVGHCHITGVSASDTVTVYIEDSANNSDWATLITFTLDGSTVDGERVATTATETVDRYVRARWDVTGTDIDFDIVVSFKRNQ